jgi:hypothetical protein
LSNLEVGEDRFDNVLEFKRWLERKVPKVKECRKCGIIVPDKTKRKE